MKRLRVILATIIAVLTLSLAGCANFKVIDDEDVFFDALDNAVGIDEDETQHAKNVTVNGDKAEYVIHAKDGDNYYTYIRFKKEDDAMEYFDEFFDDFEEINEDKDFSGSHSAATTGMKGSVTFNGEIESGAAMFLYRNDIIFDEDTEIFGGVYVNKNVYIEVYSIDGSKRDKEKIDTFLKEIGFPKP
jgi:hypothetical protein